MNKCSASCVWMNCIVIFIVLILPSLDGHALADDQVLDAETIPIQDGLLLLDRGLLDQKDWIIRTVEQEIKRARNRKPVNEDRIRSIVRRIVDAGFDNAGLAKEGALYEKTLVERIRAMTLALEPSPTLGKRITVYILEPETSKAFLRTGGRLPYLTYDAEQDQASMSLKPDSFRPSAVLTHILILPGLTDPDNAGFDEQSLRLTLNTFYLDTKMSQLVPPAELGEAFADGAFLFEKLAVFHCAAGMWGSIFKKQSQLLDDFHTGWFIYGMQYALGQHLLQQLEEDEAAQLLRFSVLGQYANQPGRLTPMPQAYLRYADFLLPIEVKGFEKLDFIRNYQKAAAFIETERLLSHLKPERVPELFQMLRNQEIDSTAKLEAAIKERFDYDIAGRLDLYATEQDPFGLHRAYLGEFKKALEAGDHDRALLALTQAHLLHLGSAVPDTPQLYDYMLTLLMKRGDHKAIQQACIARWRIGHAQAQPPKVEQRHLWASQWVAYALEHQQPSLAYPLLDLLKEEPLPRVDSVPVRMLGQLFRLIKAWQLVDAGELKAGEQLANDVIEQFPTEGAADYYNQLVRPNYESLLIRINDLQP